MELTREQVKDVLKDFYEYNDICFHDNRVKNYLNHKFPQKFKNGDIVKHVSGAIIYIVDIENDEAFGFDTLGTFRQNIWILKTFLNGAKLADHKEWLEKLTKEAERRGLVDGVKVRCLFEGNVEEIVFKVVVNSIADIKKGWCWLKSTESVVLVMKNGEWAKPLSNLDVKIEELKELAQKEKMEIEVIFKNK